jgi:hypothetical protein
MKTVCLCGSTRFKVKIRAFAKRLRELGVVVYDPYLYVGGEEWVKASPEAKRFIATGLTHDHFYKIRMADVVFVFNEGGYAGNSTTMEIGYAAALGKPIYALSGKDEEIFRAVLFREVITSPAALVKRLK